VIEVYRVFKLDNIGNAIMEWDFISKAEAQRYKHRNKNVNLDIRRVKVVKAYFPPRRYYSSEY